MPKDDRYPLIYLDGPTLARGYTSPQGGGSRFRNPDRVRAAHAARLESRFDAAWSAEQAKRVAAQAAREGVYLEFVSSPGFDLKWLSLERESSGIHLLHVRRRLVADKEQTLATIFVPDDKRSYFLRKIERYASQDTKTGAPKEAALIESIDDIREAVLESFWRNEDLARIPSDDPEWIELWIRADDTDALAKIDHELEAAGIPCGEGTLEFPERIVRLIYVNRASIESLIVSSDLVAEFRPAPSVASSVLQLSNADQTKLVEALLQRTSFDGGRDVSVCVLDTGVNRGHPLLEPAAAADDMHSVNPDWGTHDHAGHGTLMAGTVIYGDLLSAIDSGEPIRISHVLESAKILPPGRENPKELWGSITSQGMSRAEIQAPARRRVFCLATTAPDERNRGCPSSWSAALDELSSGYLDDARRLIVVCAGNSDYSTWGDYPGANMTDEVQDPAQSWNALTVGGFTRRVDIRAKELSDHAPVAPADGISPHSTTSLNWPATKWPIKPEVLFEAGNVARGQDGFITECDDLSLISTSRDPQTAMFSSFSKTSASVAQGAEFAARLSALYPMAWPETIRAAIVHSAEWTPTMLQQFPGEGKQAAAVRTRVCGYGVPDMDRAAYCLQNSLTLVSQATIQPFEIRDGDEKTKDMHFYDLPWPNEVLAGLGEVPVQMRVTLSYFVEPSPGEIGWRDRYRYASHGLRFEVNGPGETSEEFVQRINRQAREDGVGPGTTGPGDRWTIGRARDVGSIHSDIWVGTAADLAASNRVAVYPTIGWWRERKKQARVERETRYSLMVSIRVPDEEVDIYTPVAARIGIPVEVAIR